MEVDGEDPGMVQDERNQGSHLGLGMTKTNTYTNVKANTNANSNERDEREEGSHLSLSALNQFLPGLPSIPPCWEFSGTLIFSNFSLVL